MSSSITFADGSVVSSPVAGVYAVRSDLEQIFGIENIIKWANLSGVDPDSNAGLAQISARINWSISIASVDFENAMREGPYTLPITGAGASVWATNVVAILAAEWLYSHIRHAQRGADGKMPTNGYEGFTTWARQQLDFARAHKLRLDATVFGRGTNGPMVTHSPSPAVYGNNHLGYGGRPLPTGPFVG